MKQQKRNKTESSEKQPAGTPRGKPATPSGGQFTIPNADGPAPPVDEDLLRALVRQELADDQSRAVFRLIHTHGTWDDAHARILSEEFRKQKRTSGAKDG